MIDGYAIAYCDGTLAYVNRPMAISIRRIIQQIDVYSARSFKDRFFWWSTNSMHSPGHANRQFLINTKLNASLKSNVGFANCTCAWIARKAKHCWNNVTAAKPLCFIISIRDHLGKENEKLRSDVCFLMSHEGALRSHDINGFAGAVKWTLFLKIFRRFHCFSESQQLSDIVLFCPFSILNNTIKLSEFLCGWIMMISQGITTESQKNAVFVWSANHTRSFRRSRWQRLMQKPSHLIDNAIRYSEPHRKFQKHTRRWFGLWRSQLHWPADSLE